MLLNLLRAEQPDALLFCFDAGEETFRHQENATYKEGRAETPDDFYPQIPRVIELLAAVGVRHVSDPRFEADDFLCSYAQAGCRAGMRVTIVSGDRDILQLANDQVRVAIPHKGYQATEYLGAAEVLAKYGIRPDQVASWKGLMGDASDNLPGVKGIGPKTASQLLQQYESLEGIYAHLADIRPAVRSKLEHDREQAFFCERMARLVCDIPLPVPLDELAMRDLPAETLQQFFDAFEFTLLTRRLREYLATEPGRRMFQAPAAMQVSKPAAAQDAAAQMALL
ncbi:MAG: DNA polymerase I family protein [Candidatus Peregrinibacteria bacterium Gr01-1014_25]|nr:MAG: DNA polymerase I family protein [Candidatus Peregrinibacteria bacterium Gr01-1014_25]